MDDLVPFTRVNGVIRHTRPIHTLSARSGDGEIAMESDEELSARLLLLENQVSEVRREVRRKHRMGRDGVQRHAILEILLRRAGSSAVLGFRDTRQRSWATVQPSWPSSKEDRVFAGGVQS